MDICLQAYTGSKEHCIYCDSVADCYEQRLGGAKFYCDTHKPQSVYLTFEQIEMMREVIDFLDNEGDIGPVTNSSDGIYTLDIECDDVTLYCSNGEAACYSVIKHENCEFDCGEDECGAAKQCTNGCQQPRICEEHGTCTNCDCDCPVDYDPPCDFSGFHPTGV